LEKPKQPAKPNSDAEHAQEKQEDERKAHCLALLEAALYVAGRPLDINEMCQVIGSRSKKKAQKYAFLLILGYSQRDTALEILALKDDRYVLKSKQTTRTYPKTCEPSLVVSGPLKTLPTCHSPALPKNGSLT
jgi:hypothetical protein